MNNGILISILVVGPFCVSSHSQNMFLEEDFTTGIPADWSQITLGWGGDIFETGFKKVDGSPDVYHEAWCNFGFFFRDNHLLTPPMDFSGLNSVAFRCDQFHAAAASMVYNGIEVTTDGGASFTPAHVLTGTVDGFSTLDVDLDPWVGKKNVQVSFHYQSAIGNEWSIDNVRIHTPQPVYTVQNLASRANARFTLSGASPGGIAVMAWSVIGPGPLPVGFGNIDLSPPVFLLPYQFTGPSGIAQNNIPVPPGLSGISFWTHGADVLLGSQITLSNSISTVIQ